MLYMLLVYVELSLLRGVVSLTWSCLICVSQAYREGEEDQALAGLVPSKMFWENKEQLRLQVLAETAEQENQATCCPSGKKKRKKSQYNADESEFNRCSVSVE